MDEVLDSQINILKNELTSERDRLNYLTGYFSQLINSITAGILVTDEDLFITEYNRAAEKLLSNNGSLDGKALWDLLPEIESGRNLREDEIFKKFDNFQTEIVITGSDGSKIPVLVSTSLINNPHGEIHGVICIIQDLSERKQFENRLLQARKLESVGQLAAGVAHEINTPIQYVRDNMIFLQKEFEGLCNLLKEVSKGIENGNQFDKQSLEKIKTLKDKLDLDYLLNEIPIAIKQTLEGSDSVAKIVNSMKEFSHPGTENRVMLNINEALQSTLTVSRNEWKYVADTSLSLCDPPPLVNCFPAELNQAFLNIIINAAHAIEEASLTGRKEKGLISITTSLKDDCAIIEIGDTGSGIPDSIKDKVFDPFFTTKDVGKGTGQGLSIAHASIVVKHEGKISFETKVGKGTTFRIELPIE